jgi:hypothetical protein
MTKKHKKSPASNVDVSEQKQGDSDAALTGTSSFEERVVSKAVADAPLLSEYLRIGECFSKCIEKTIAAYTAENGDTPQNRQHAQDVAYLYLNKKFGRSRASARLYIRCYQRFTESPDLVHTLPLKDWVARAGLNPGAI